MKNKTYLALVVMGTIIALTLQAAAVNQVFDKGWKDQVGKKSELHSLDGECSKGMIMARYSDGSLRCAWPSNNAKRIKEKTSLVVISEPPQVFCEEEVKPTKLERTCEVVCDKRNKFGHCVDYDLTCTSYSEASFSSYSVCTGEVLECSEYEVSDLDFFLGFGWKIVEKSRSCEVVNNNEVNV